MKRVFENVRRIVPYSLELYELEFHKMPNKRACNHFKPIDRAPFAYYWDFDCLDYRSYGNSWLEETESEPFSIGNQGFLNKMWEMMKYLAYAVMNMSLNHYDSYSKENYSNFVPSALPTDLHFH